MKTAKYPLAVLTEGKKTSLYHIRTWPDTTYACCLSPSVNTPLICEKPSSIFWKTSSEALKSCYWIPPKLSLLQAKQAQSGLSASPHVLQFPVILVPVS